MLTPGSAATSTAFDRAGRREHPLRGREIERGERQAAELAGVAEAEQPDDLEVLGRALEQHLHAVADLEPVLPRGAGVHRHLAVGTRRPARPVVDELERAPPVERHPGHPQRREDAVLDRLAVRLDELGVAHRRTRRRRRRRRRHGPPRSVRREAGCAGLPRGTRRTRSRRRRPAECARRRRRRRADHRRPRRTTPATCRSARRYR